MSSTTWFIHRPLSELKYSSFFSLPGPHLYSLTSFITCPRRRFPSFSTNQELADHTKQRASVAAWSSGVHYSPHIRRQHRRRSSLECFSRGGKKAKWFICRKGDATSFLSTPDPMLAGWRFSIMGSSSTISYGPSIPDLLALNGQSSKSWCWKLFLRFCMEEPSVRYVIRARLHKDNSRRGLVLSLCCCCCCLFSSIIARVLADTGVDRSSCSQDLANSSMMLTSPTKRRGGAPRQVGNTPKCAT